MEASNPIGELLSRQIPDKLWHYTSVQGFQGIVTSKKIFATDTRFLNDREEFTHALKIAGEVVEETPEFVANKFPAREYLKKAVDLAFRTGPLQPGRLQVFVAAFSAAEDQLSQWRGYSRGSSGASLAFDLKALRPPTDIGTLVSFAPCIYDPTSKKKLIQHALHHFMDEVSSYWNGTFEAAPQLQAGATCDNKPSLGEFIARIPNSSNFNSRLAEAMIKTNADLCASQHF